MRSHILEFKCLGRSGPPEFIRERVVLRTGVWAEDRKLLQHLPRGCNALFYLTLCISCRSDPSVLDHFFIVKTHRSHTVRSKIKSFWKPGRSGLCVTIELGLFFNSKCLDFTYMCVCICVWHTYVQTHIYMYLCTYIYLLERQRKKGDAQCRKRSVQQ